MRPMVHVNVLDGIKADKDAKVKGDVFEKWLKGEPFNENCS
jgi:hypothetical protein